MLSFALALVVGALSLMAFFEWRKSKLGSTQTTARLQKEVAQHLTLGHHDEAFRLLRKLLGKKITDPQTQALHVHYLRKTSQLAQAESVLCRALESHENALVLHKERGKLLIEKGEAKEALIAFRKSLRLLQGEEDLTDLANVYYHLGNVTNAWETIAPFLQRSPSGRTLALAGDCCFSRSDFSGAFTYYRVAQNKGMNNQQFFSRMGHCLRRLEKFAEAERCFAAILEKDQANVAATLSLGACLEAQDLYPRALMIYQQSKAWDAGDHRILRQAGVCAVHTERFDFAELYLREAILGGSNSVQALAYLAYTLERQDKWKGAEKVYLNLTREHSDHVAGYRGAAWLYGVGLSKEIDAETGLQMAHQSLQILPDAISWETLSACEARAGNFGEAHHIQECLSTQEHDPNTLLRRQRAMRSLRQGIPLDEHLVAKALVA